MKIIKEAHKRLPFLDPIINMIFGGVAGGCFSELVHDFRSGNTPLVTDPAIIILVVCLILAFIYNKNYGVSASVDIISESLQQHVSEIIIHDDIEGAEKTKKIIHVLDLPSIREVRNSSSENRSQEIRPIDGNHEQG